jgi:hypothetical protein
MNFENQGIEKTEKIKVLHKVIHTLSGWASP